MRPRPCPSFAVNRTEVFQRSGLRELGELPVGIEHGSFEPPIVGDDRVRDVVGSMIQSTDQA